MFGVKQVMDFVEKTGKTRFTIKELARARGVREESAKRYVHEAQRFGIAVVKGNRVEVDPIRMAILREALWGLDSVESLLRLLRALEKKGLIREVRVQRAGDPEGTVEKFMVLLPPDKRDEKLLEFIKEQVEKYNQKLIALLLPSYLVGDVYLFLRNRFNLPPNSLIELSSDMGLIVFRRGEEEE